MEKEITNRSRIIGLRLTPKEYEAIEKKWKSSNCRKLSDYVRRVIFEKPIVMMHRNASLDEFMAESIRLRNELNSIGNNINQAVKKMYVLKDVAEFRYWIPTFEVYREILFSKTDQIKRHIQKIAEQWLQ